MTSILMVCLGNICRSPLAHGILESKLPSDQFYIDSAGTANYHVGDSPDHRSIAVAKSNGIDISNQRGRQFKVSDFDTFDYIFTMDDSNYQNIIALARGANDIAKVKCILELEDTIQLTHVPDPYYGDISDFQNVFQLLEKVCNTLSNKLQNITL
ncbi:low molecular weight protein-tyrosine-phosphatase [Psychroserpens ponticola]|uniref:protein-tyrosine-phosphatase n=1 Tax=Psychroserpens ponticola TaxID=2932268 RepID=A0ABY7RTV4_9FLAO|nr:low molecular weight protein-tyrosine-phosphatase [Psychroserpens ponticola]WCO00534.1 low molecular weight phosphotyrosine protein phosphatase [Psychroserpens ponticola]